MEEILKLILDKLDHLDQKIDVLDRRMTSMEERMTSMEERMTSMEERMKSMEERMKSMEERMTAMEERMTAMEERITAVESEQKRHGELLHQLINTVAATNIKISETNERVDSLEIKVDTLIDDVKEIKNTMAVKTDLEYYDRMISEHSREIYKLKNN
ncbi:hypothetical protein [Neobacillus mesonae]|uniref:coiled-coil domain-containing protein n=1 Tax=Neobacillus mesonae TaxID=1193713 RepID=UPI002041EB0F|nr:hypothetical protein [Neobacillus mesonae]MCM3570835.1 hypothetical protein [Neobacillus mesonae]